MKTIKGQLRELFPNDMRKYNRGGKYIGWARQKKKKQINCNVTPEMYRGIEIIVESGKFPNRSEFIRHLIVNYFDKVIYDD